MSQLVAQSESPDPSFQRRPESIVDHRTPSFKAAELHEPLAALLRRCLEMSVADFTQKFFLSQSTAPDMKNMVKYSRALCHCEGARASKEGEVEEEEEGVVGRKAEGGGVTLTLLPSGLAQMKTRTLRPVGTWCGGRALMLPLMAALRSADSRGQGCLLPTPDGHIGGDFQRGCTHAQKGGREEGMLTRPGTHRQAHGKHMHVCAQIHLIHPHTRTHAGSVNYGKGMELCLIAVCYYFIIIICY